MTKLTSVFRITGYSITGDILFRHYAPSFNTMERDALVEEARRWPKVTAVECVTRPQREGTRVCCGDHSASGFEHRRATAYSRKEIA